MSDTQKNHEIRIANVPTGIYKDLGIISQNLGITVSSLIKSKLPEIVKSFPAEAVRKQVN